jgi:anti-sigma regulatory factor (Ser/Thr protein kinase)/biotin operon repressor
LTRVRARGEEVRRFIIANVEKRPQDISRVVAQRFGISRQAVNLHLRRLVDEGALEAKGTTRSRTYTLAQLISWSEVYVIADQPTEDRVWHRDIAPHLGSVPQNVSDIWQYGFTEMFNNALEHSEGTAVAVDLTKTAASTELTISDDGVGIFRKIQAALGLDDARHSVLELAKGKFTTDPARHSGEGIFFSSRMFDEFVILSGEVLFSHESPDVEDWILERERGVTGTLVSMSLSDHTARTTKKVFDRFTTGDDDYGFTKTVVPVDLTRYGDDNLVSRSQARRLLARVDRFKTVVLDFQGVDAIGQAFADEVFRVFPSLHPEVRIAEVNARSAVKRMISRARSAAQDPAASPAATDDDDQMSLL